MRACPQSSNPPPPVTENPFLRTFLKESFFSTYFDACKNDLEQMILLNHNFAINKINKKHFNFRQGVILAPPFAKVVFYFSFLKAPKRLGGRALQIFPLFLSFQN